MKRNMLIILIMSLLALLLLASCSSGSNSSKEGNNNNENNDESVNPDTIDEDVTIKILTGITEEDFEEFYKKPAEDKFPKVTIEQIPINPDAEAIEEELLKGNIPDIVRGGNPRGLFELTESELLYDMTDLIEKYNFDLKRLDPDFLNLTTSYAGGDKIWVLPIEQERYVLHYNKDIFDKLGVDYPTDGMTWDEIIDIAEEVSVDRDGDSYSGLSMPGLSIVLSTESVLMVDLETDKPLFDTDPFFKKVVDMYQRVYELPNANPEIDWYGGFIGERTLAMFPSYFLGVGWTGLLTAQEEGLNWDMVTFPIWEKDKPVSPAADWTWMGVTSASENQDAAFKVLDFWLSPDESVKKVGYKESITFESEMEKIDRDPRLEEKNNEALIKYSPIPDPPLNRSEYEYIVESIFIEELEKFIDPSENDGQETNTFLQELQEKAEAAIMNEKNK